MLPDHIREFVSQNHQAVFTTFRRSGAAQMSIVTVGAYRDGVAFTTTVGRAKLSNLNRDPRCSLLVSKQDWWGYVVLEGRAVVMSSHNTDPQRLALALGEVYRAATGTEHPDWDQYDEAMVKDRRVAIVVVPERTYGTSA